MQNYRITVPGGDDTWVEEYLVRTHQDQPGSTIEDEESEDAGLDATPRNHRLTTGKSLMNAKPVPKSSDSSIQPLLDDVRRHNKDGPQYDDAKTRALIIKAQAGDVEARNTLMVTNTPLVVTLAAGYSRRHSWIDINDLIQVGVIHGLGGAIRKFNVEFPFRFSTYATWWIHQSIRREIAEMGGAVRVPIYLYQKLDKLDRATGTHQEDLASSGVRLGYTAKLMKHLDQARPFLRNRDGIRTLISADPENNGIDLVELVDVNSSADEVVERCHQNETLARVMLAFEPLPPREIQVLSMRLGLPPFDGAMTLSDCGRALQVTRERVRQLETRALAQLRRAMDLPPSTASVSGGPGNRTQVRQRRSQLSQRAPRRRQASA